MKAAVRTRYGPPDVVRIAQVQAPTVTGRDVLVKIHAATGRKIGNVVITVDPER